MFVTITRTSEKHSDLTYHHEQECVLHGFTLKEVLGMYEVDEKELQKFCDIQDDYRWFITDESLNEYFKDPMDDLLKEFEKKMELERQWAEEYAA